MARRSSPIGNPPEAGRGAPRTAILVKGYPRLSETFIAQELLALQQRGQRQLIVALRRPTDRAVHALNRRIEAPVLYLPEYLKDAPARVLRGLAWAMRRPGFGRACRRFLADLARDPTANRLRRFGQACVLARELPADIHWLHAHFLHTPASVARYTALILGLPWSFSAHAKDIWTTPDWDLRDKLAEAAWGVTCTAANHARLAALAVRPGALHLAYHGLDAGRFPPPAARPPRDGTDPADPVRLLTVCRAVEKKGLDILLAALAGLPPSLAWRLTHIGGGDLSAALQAEAERLGLAGRITWLGAQDQARVAAEYAAADLFVLAARIARDGDRDGLPNVLMEAQATGLACLATRVSAIPELIEPGVTGVLVEPDQPAALSQALAGLIADPGRRAALGRAGAERVRSRFGVERGLATLTDLFGLDRAAAAA